METGLYLFPWSLADEGVDHVLEAVIGRSGCDSVSVAFNYHTAKFLHPRPHPHFHFAGQASAYFRPQLERYEATQLKPVASPLVQERDVLAEAREAARKLGLRFHAWIVCLHSTLLGMHHPDVVVRTVYGDPLPFALSPSHPDVREYIKQLVLDIALNYEPDSLELESIEYVPLVHGYHHELEGVRLDPFHQALLGVDFSPSARDDLARRGVDVEFCMLFIRRRLEHFFSSSRYEYENGWELFGQLFLEEPEIQKLFRARIAIVTDLVEEIVSTLDKQVDVEVKLILSPWDRAPHQLWMEGQSARDLALLGNQLLAPAYFSEPPAIARCLASLEGQIGDLGNVTPVLLAIPPIVGSKQQLLEAVQMVRSSGIRRVSFYNYSFVRAEVLDWIRDATTLTVHE